MDIHSLLKLLSDGQYHSGSELGASLGVTRAAVWKALKRLTQFNLEIKSDKNRGYQLVGGLELLDCDAIEELLPEKTKSSISLTLALKVDSTNLRLLEINDNGGRQNRYSVSMAEMQTAGRGRRGQPWISPFGKNIYLSIGFNLPGGVEVLNGLSLVVGIAVIRMLRSQGIEGAKLKWPNDIWIGSKKLGGILVELKGEATTDWYVVAGIGLNVRMTELDGRNIDQLWTSICEHHECSRNRLAAGLIENLVEVLCLFKEQGFDGFMGEWSQYDLLKGRQVKLSAGNIEGVATGIDSKGALLVDTGDEQLTVNAGEVSVRPNET